MTERGNNRALKVVTLAQYILLRVTSNAFCSPSLLLKISLIKIDNCMSIFTTNLFPKNVVRSLFFLQDYLPPIYPDYFVYKGLPDLPESYYDRFLLYVQEVLTYY